MGAHPKDLLEIFDIPVHDPRGHLCPFWIYANYAGPLFKIALHTLYTYRQEALSLVADGLHCTLVEVEPPFRVERTCYPRLFSMEYGALHG